MVGRDALARGRECQREGSGAMSMRRTIGISLACLVTSACAIDKTPEQESISHYPGEIPESPQGNGETPTGASPGSAEGLNTMVSSPTVTSEVAEQPSAGFEPAAYGRYGTPEPCCRGWRMTGTTLRSEERRVGKECRSRWWREHE